MTIVISDNANESILHLLPPGAKVCEIGIRSGQSSRAFLNRGCFLYMVDPWQGYDEYTESACYYFEDDKRAAIENVTPWIGRYVIIEKKANEALPDIPIDLDLVYIDGNHAYEFVKLDCELYFRKLKPGGWLTGDDFSMPSVAGAVGEFWSMLRSNYPKIQLELFGRNWALQKPL